MFKLTFKIIILIIVCSPSYAYLGPGVGGGIIAATLGIIVAIFAAILALIWFPLKRIFKKKKLKQNSKK